MTTTVTPNRGGEIDQRIELLHVAGPRDGEEARDGELSGRATIAERDLPPLDNARFILIRSPGFRGISAGAITSQLTRDVVISRCNA